MFDGKGIPMRAVFLLVLIFFSLAFLFPAAAQNKKDPGPQGPPPALVVTAPVVEERVQSPQTLIGTSEPRYQAAIAAEMEGLVTQLKVRKGEHVPKGAEIVTLRTLPAELELQESRSRLKEVQARIEKAESDLKRAEGLFAQKFISEEELQSRRTEVDALRRQAQQIQARIRIQKDRLQRMTVEAPFAGRVVEERTETGQWLSEGDPVVLLADLSVMHIMVPVPERRISGISVGDTAEVGFDALPGETFSGEVTAIVPRADTASRTFPVQISVKNPDNRIMSGMLSRVTFFTDIPDTALLLPKDAFVPQPGGGGHIVKVEEGQAILVPVNILGTHGDHYAVEPLGENGLSAGDRVVIRGNERLRPGQNIREAKRPE